MLASSIVKGLFFRLAWYSTTIAQGSEPTTKPPCDGVVASQETNSTMLLYHNPTPHSSTIPPEAANPHHTILCGRSLRKRDVGKGTLWYTFPAW